MSSGPVLATRFESSLRRGIVKDLTGMNPSERAAASTFLRVMVAPRRGSPVMSAFSGVGESS
jgi:hypothetical protein